MREFWLLVGRFLNNPYVNIVLGFGLVASALLETTDTVVEQALGIHIGAHHGVALLGLMTIIQALHELFAGLQHVQRTHNGGPRRRQDGQPRAVR